MVCKRTILVACALLLVLALTPAARAQTMQDLGYHPINPNATQPHDSFWWPTCDGWYAGHVPHDTWWADALIQDGVVTGALLLGPRNYIAITGWIAPSDPPPGFFDYCPWSSWLLDETQRDLYWAVDGSGYVLSVSRSDPRHGYYYHHLRGYAKYMPGHRAPGERLLAPSPTPPRGVVYGQSADDEALLVYTPDGATYWWYPDGREIEIHGPVEAGAPVPPMTDAGRQVEQAVLLEARAQYLLSELHHQWKIHNQLAGIMPDISQESRELSRQLTRVMWEVYNLHVALPSHEGVQARWRSIQTMHRQSAELMKSMYRMVKTRQAQPPISPTLGPLPEDVPFQPHPSPLPNPVAPPPPPPSPLPARTSQTQDEINRLNQAMNDLRLQVEYRAHQVYDQHIALGSFVSGACFQCLEAQGASEARKVYPGFGTGDAGRQAWGNHVQSIVDRATDTYPNGWVGASPTPQPIVDVRSIMNQIMQMDTITLRQCIDSICF